jgi:hypothetical protein
MTMKDFTRCLALLSLVVAGLACFFSIASATTASAYDGLTLEKSFAAPENENRRATSLSCYANNLEPAVGENVIFSGYLRDNDNSPIAGENITLYKLLLENDISLGSVTTDENGYFTLSLETPDRGIFCYMARFPGNDDYENSASTVYLSNIDKPLIFWSYTGILMAVVGVGIFLLRMGIPKAHYLMPVLIGFTLGFLLIFIGAGMLSILAGGAITGYLFAKNAPEWTKHLRIGCITGLIFLLALGLIFVYYIIAFPPELVVLYSITQAGIFASLFDSTIFSLLYYLLFVGMGAVVGGMLRKLLKPGEQKPPTGSGETTSSGVEQPQETAPAPTAAWSARRS